MEEIVKAVWIMSITGTLLSMTALAQAPAPGGAGAFTAVPAGEAVVSKITGISVDDPAKQHLGTIREIAYLGPDVKAYVLEAGGHVVAVSPSALSFNYDAAAKSWGATMRATADQIKAAPEFNAPPSN